MFVGYWLGWRWRAEFRLKGKDGSREFGVWSRKLRAGNNVKEDERLSSRTASSREASSTKKQPKRSRQPL
jgi:hypothetical protein